MPPKRQAPGASDQPETQTSDEKAEVVINLDPSDALIQSLKKRVAEAVQKRVQAEKQAEEAEKQLQEMVQKRVEAEKQAEAEKRQEDADREARDALSAVWALYAEASPSNRPIASGSASTSTGSGEASPPDAQSGAPGQMQKGASVVPKKKRAKLLIGEVRLQELWEDVTLDVNKSDAHFFFDDTQKPNYVLRLKQHLKFPACRVLIQGFVELKVDSKPAELRYRLIDRVAAWALANKVCFGYIHVLGVDNSGWTIYRFERKPFPAAVAAASPKLFPLWMCHTVDKVQVMEQMADIDEIRINILQGALDRLKTIASGEDLVLGEKSQLCCIYKRFERTVPTNLQDEVLLQFMTEKKAQVVCGSLLRQDTNTLVRYIPKTFPNDAAFELEKRNLDLVYDARKEWGKEGFFCAVCPVAKEELPVGFTLPPRTILFETIGTKMAVENNDEAVQFWRELLETLEEIHKRGVMHLDICPRNLVRITEPGTDVAHLCLIDFGSCERMEEEGRTRYRAQWITRTFALPIKIVPGLEDSLLQAWDRFALCMTILCARFPNEAEHFYAEDSEAWTVHSTQQLQEHEMCLNNFLKTLLTCTSSEDTKLNCIVKMAESLLKECSPPKSSGKIETVLGDDDVTTVA